MADIASPPPPPPPIEPPTYLPPPVAETAPQALPWETPGYPALEGLYETAKLFLTRPSEAFARMSTAGDLGRPLGYAIIFGWIGIIAGQLYNIALDSTMRSWMAPWARGEQLHLGVAFNVGMMIAAPVLILIGVFVSSAIVHLFLMLVGGNTKGFSATARVMCYANSVQVLQVVPFCGSLIGAIWAIVLEIKGIAIAHRTTQGKAALAVLLPIVLCCVCIAILAVAFGAAIMAAIGRMR